jgi:hypothetical protein
VNLNAIIANNTLLGTDPKLANVGTKDFYPLAGSPVLGGGTPGQTKRGFSRFVGE